MEHQLKEEIKENLELDTHETSNNISGFDVINIKKEEDETYLESTAAAAFDRVEEYEMENQSSKIKSEMQPSSPNSEEMNDYKTGMKKFSDAKFKVTHNTNQIHECKVCNKRFKNNFLVKRHMSSHTGEKPYGCSDCNKTFSLLSNMQRHMKGHVINKLKEMQPSLPIAEKMNDCKTGKKKFSDPKFKVTDSDTNKTHECKVCNKKFKHNFLVKRHMRSHTGEKPYACSDCNKKFSLLCSLQRHKKGHVINRLKEMQPSSPNAEEINDCKTDKKMFSDAKFKVTDSGTNKIHECKICNKRFGNNFLVKRHMRSHTGEKPYDCSDCNKKFSSLINMQRHKKRHTVKTLKKVTDSGTNKIHECKICNKRFGNNCLVKRHMRFHTGEKSYECSVCNEKFLILNNMKRHKELHAINRLKEVTDKAHQCEICYKKFSNRNSLINHATLHTGARPFECSKCDKTYTLKSTLNFHMQTHMTKIKKEAIENRYQCEHCDKKLFNRSAFIYHTRVHTGERPYECSKCDKKFIVISALNAHMDTHIKKEAIENGYQCEHCDKKLINTSAFIYHTRVHTGERPYECSKCDKKFIVISALNAHMEIHIKKPISCEICHKILESKYTFKLHMNKHTREKVFKCSECNREFLRNQSLKNHWLNEKFVYKNGKIEPNSCEICHKSFGMKCALKLHMNMHKRKKLFKCSECDKRFFRKYNFDIHLLIHNKEKLKITKEIDERSHNSFTQITRLTPDDPMGEMKVQHINIKAEKIDLVEPNVYEYIQSEKNETEETPKFVLPDNSSFEASMCKEEVILPDQ